MGEGPKDLRDDAGRFDAPRNTDMTGRGEADVVGRGTADVMPGTSGTGPSTEALPVITSVPPTADRDDLAQRGTTNTSGLTGGTTAAGTGTAGTTPETAEIRAEIEQKRADISETIDEISQRLAPSNLVSQATDSVREATKDSARRVADRSRELAGTVTTQARENPWSAGAVLAGIGVAAWWMMRRRRDEMEDWDVDDYSEESLYYDDTDFDDEFDEGNRVMNVIRENPVPIALTAAGIGWLLWNQRSSRVSSYGSGYPASNFDSSFTSETGYGAAGADAGAYRSYDADRGVWVSEETGGATERVREVVSNAGERARDVVAGAGERARSAVDNVSGRTRAMASRAQSQVGQASRQARTQLQHWMDENPLAVGAVAMAVGVAVGMALPETRREQEMMGDARDRVMDRGRELAHRAVDKATEAAQQVVGKAQGAAESAEQGASTAQDAINRASSAAKSTIDKATK